MNQSDSFRRLRRRAAVQMSYAALFAMFVLWPNLRVAPSLVIVVATALAAVWLVGGLAAWAKIPGLMSSCSADRQRRCWSP